MADDANKRLSIPQVVALLATVGTISGAGGAYTVSAQDAKQDTRIEHVERDLATLAKESRKTHDKVIEVSVTVESTKEDVSELKADTKDIQRMLNRLIARGGG